MATKNKAGEPPLVSVCVPVYDTERFLEKCLESALAQDFDRFEIVVASDASRGKDERGRSAKKIIKAAQRQSDKARKLKGLPAIPVKFVESYQNRGILETRRTLLCEARGAFVAFLDSDDEFLPGALLALHGAALQYGADIVHGEFVSGDYDSSGVFQATEVTKCGAIHHGVLDGSQIARSWSAGLLNGNVIGKLISRPLLERAFEKIPYTECTMAEDFLIFFYLSVHAARYVGISQKVYQYRVTSGVSSSRKIDTMRKWRMVCSAASAFADVSLMIKECQAEGILTDDDIEHMGKVTISYVANSLTQMRQRVVPELQEEAYAMLCEYWGEGFVKNVDAAMNPARGDK